MNAFVIMTAMPPTKGHVRLIEFATRLNRDLTVMVMTQPNEPFAYERIEALRDHFPGQNIEWVHFHRTIEQNPETPGFREMWQGIMSSHGCGRGSVIVSSESYGVWLSEITGATFIPYDPERILTKIKATDIRNEPLTQFHKIAEQFQRHLRINVTVFGAESTGKTTLSRSLAKLMDGHWFFEYARPYLEMVGPDITVKSMEAIWEGQEALEAHSHQFYDRPYAFYDTDLYSTIGYWAMPHWADHLGPVPQGLINAATPNDLYLIPRSNIPFEEDPIRYGGDRREASDQYWIAVAEQYGLNYVVLESPDRTDRIYEAMQALRPFEKRLKDSLAFDRGGF